MTYVAIGDWIETTEVWAGGALMFVCPCLFFVGAWLVDRRRRRRRASASRRLFALSLFAAAVLVLFFALIRVPPTWQFSGGSPTIIAISYMIGLGWLSIPLLAGPCFLIAICSAIICRVAESRRPAVMQ